MLPYFLSHASPQYLSFSHTFSNSDIDDGGEVEENIRYNFEINNLSPVLHIPHTWGTGIIQYVLLIDHFQFLSPLLMQSYPSQSIFFL